ncbi:MAG: hypothetical protein ACYCOU_24700, partial [Sulfobacillus sp.]
QGIDTGTSSEDLISALEILGYQPISGSLLFPETSAGSAAEIIGTVLSQTESYSSILDAIALKISGTSTGSSLDWRSVLLGILVLAAVGIGIYLAYDYFFAGKSKQTGGGKVSNRLRVTSSGTILDRSLPDPVW